jgi:hypothetical protein
MSDAAKAPARNDFVPVSRGQQQTNVPHFYFNGFEINSSLSDMGLLLLLDNQPQTRLSMSFTMAKTLVENLGRAVTEFERRTSHDIMTMEQVRSGFDKTEEKN